MPTGSDQQMDTRRAAARRTALIVAGIALAVYIGFIVLNVVGQGQ
ncbi:MAG: hypothetical protein ABL934_15465 [Lysobacteraceae bacterium]